jgi:cytochrome c peroxidase
MYIGGNFWDGHEPDEAHQALQPFIDPNETANTAFTAQMGVGSLP